MASRRDVIAERGNFALDAYIRWMGHWMRKGDADRAARNARDAAHVANAVLRRQEATSHDQ